MSKNYVKEYKGYKVPEGASCFVEACEAYRNHFGKTVAGVDYVFVVDNEDPEWVSLSDMLPLSIRGAVELPEEPTQEWVDGLPPVGCECFVEYPYDDGCFKPFHGKKVTILGYCSDSDGESVFTAHGSNGFIALYANGFRPLKTQEQKDREAFIEWANKATNADGKDHTVVDLFNDLFDAGFKAPDGE